MEAAASVALESLFQWMQHSANELRNGILVGATLLVSLSFQAAIAPPGGFWQEDSPSSNNNNTSQKNYAAGNPIWQDKYPSKFNRFRIVNAAAFALSVIAIVVTISSMLERRSTYTLFVAAMAFTMSMILTAVAFSLAI